REPSRSGLARRSRMATSTLANASSAASIMPVGPPPAITTACSVIAAFLLEPLGCESVLLRTQTPRQSEATHCPSSVCSLPNRRDTVRERLRRPRELLVDVLQHVFGLHLVALGEESPKR